MQAPAEAIQLTVSYVRICGGGILFIVAYNLLAAIFRGLGDSRSPLLFVLVACIVNIAGDLLLVGRLSHGRRRCSHRHSGRPGYQRRSGHQPAHQKEDALYHPAGRFPPESPVPEVSRHRLPLALQEFLTQLSFLALCAFVNRLGLTASSGYGVACKIVNFAMLIPSALMQSMASFVAQNVGAGNEKRARKAMFTGIGLGLMFGCAVFVLVLCKGDVLAGIFSPDAEVVQKGFEYLKGFAPETILTAILFSMVGYFNGNNQTLWVMIQGLVQTLLIRLPMAYCMSMQPNASLTKIGLSAPTSTLVGIVLNVGYYLYWSRKNKEAAPAASASTS